MKTFLRSLILVSLVFGLFATPPARAQAGEPGAQLPLPRRTRYITLVGLDFHPIRNDLRYFFNEGGIYPLNAVDPDPRRFNAPLYFPNDAILTAVDLYYIDDNPSAYLSLKIIRFDPVVDSGQEVVAFDTMGSSASSNVRTLTWAGPDLPVDDRLAYRVQVDFGAAGDTLLLQGMRITYTVPFLGGGETCITIAGGDFVPNHTDLMYRANGQAQYIVQQTYPVEGWLIAPLDLPDGAKINRVDFYVEDEDMLDDITVYFARKDPAIDPYQSSQGWQLLYFSKTVLYPPFIQNIFTSGSPFHTADTRHYSYLLGAALRDPSTDHLLVGARVCYDPPDAVQGMQTRTYMGSAFRPFSTSLLYSKYNSSLGSLFVTGDNTNGIFGVNLNLPDGVMIRRVVYYFTDNSAENFFLAGRKFVPSLRTAGYLFDEKAWNYDPSPDIRTITIDLPGGKEAVYDSDLDNYRLVALLPGAAQDNLLLHGARVDYYVPRFIYLPAVRK